MLSSGRHFGQPGHAAVRGCVRTGAEAAGRYCKFSGLETEKNGEIVYSCLFIAHSYCSLISAENFNVYSELGYLTPKPNPNRTLRSVSDELVGFTVSENFLK